MRPIRSVIVLAVAPLLCHAQGVIYTVAGLGPASAINGDIGDGGPATRAYLDNPDGLTVDTAGNLYIWEGTSYRIRKVNAAGIISTFAGNGSNGSSGDGGLATSAQLGLHTAGSGLATDSAGNLYIAGGINNRVRKVDTSGKITTVAGNGTGTTPGAPSGDGKPATTVPLCTPSSVALDQAGNLYIGSSICYTIRKVDTSGIITTVAGGGFGFSGDGGPATQAAMGQPVAIAVDRVGNIYFADGLLASRVRKVNTDGVISTIAGNGTRGFSGDGGAATSAQISRVNALAVDGAGNVFISDAGNGRIRRVDTSGIITTVVGGGTQISVKDGAAANTLLFTPADVAVDVSGNLYVPNRNFVYRVTGVASAGPPPAPPSGSVTKTVSAAGQRSGPVAPESIVIASGSHLATGSATADLDSPGTTLAGTTVKVTDANGSTLQALVLSVSSTQVTYQVPAGLAAGPATVTITAGDGVSATATLQIAAVAPGLYTLNSSGLVKGYAIRISNGNTFIEDVFEIDATGAVIARPITISNGDQVYLIVYGTGFRAAGGDISATVGGIGAPILYAGAQGVQPGLDQFTTLLPPELATGGPQVVQIVLTAGGQTANVGNVTVQ